MKLLGKICAATAASALLLTTAPVAHAGVNWGAAAGAIIGGLLSQGAKNSNKSGNSSGGQLSGLSNQKHAHPNPTDNEKLFLLAVKNNDFNTVQSMLDAGVDINGVYFAESETALGASLYNREMMQFLLERGADVNGYYDIKSGDHWSYLNIVAFDLDYDTAKYLFDWGADPNDAFLAGNVARYGSICRGGASLHFALSKALAEGPAKNNIIQLLLDRGANPDIKNRDGETAYIYAIKHNSLDVIQILAQGGADLNARDEHGRTALQIALDKKDLQLCKVVQDIMARGQQPSKYQELKANAQKKKLISTELLDYVNFVNSKRSVSISTSETLTDLMNNNATYSIKERSAKAKTLISPLEKTIEELKNYSPALSNQTAEDKTAAKTWKEALISRLNCQLKVVKIFSAEKEFTPEDIDTIYAITKEESLYLDEISKHGDKLIETLKKFV